MKQLYSNHFQWRMLIISAVLVLVSGILALMVGTYALTPTAVWQAFFSGAGAEEESLRLAVMIVQDIRLPRLLMAATAGVALATAGAVFQGCFHNPLVEPYILGVSGGAAFGAALAIVFPLVWLPAPLLAFFFGIAAVVAAHVLATRGAQTAVLALMLAGIVIGGVFSALVSMLKYISGDAALREIVFWLMGGFYHVTWSDLRVVMPVVAAGFSLSWLMGWRLNVLSMGDEEARALGVHPQRNKRLLIGLATLMTAITVASCGIIAWIGLMMPHAARLLLGSDHRYVIPMSAAMGAIYLIWCDTLARTLTGAEIPVGIITALVGAPYLLYLLRTSNSGIT
jgi:iron complex transport system permease protein